MKLRAVDMEIIQSGWYEENQHIGVMRNDKQYKPFTRRDIFPSYDPSPTKIPLFERVLD